jgi:NAD-dependent DNA ligase
MSGMAGVVVPKPTTMSGMAVGKLAGKSIVLTGFRDKELEAAIVASGGSVAGAVSKSTFALIVKNKEDCGSTKYAAAIKLGIPVYDAVEFREKYM